MGGTSTKEIPRSADGTPVIPLVGWSNSGKTTLLEKIVGLLRERGLRVGVVKHHGHPSPLDTPGKDSWRYSEAGASPVVVASAAECLVIRRPKTDPSLKELVELAAPECDVVLSEGFKWQAGFGIELLRKAHNPKRILDNAHAIALVTDSEEEACRARLEEVPVFSLADVEGIASFIEGLAKGPGL